MSDSWRQRLDGLPARELDDGLRVHEARGLGARLRGLGGLDDLPGDRALLLAGTRAVHTLTMRFALDLIWIGRDGHVLRVDRDVAPRRHRACLRSAGVVEVRAGCADRFLRAGIASYT